MARMAAAALSTKVALAAPRESASMPSAPEPANRSSTRAPSTRSARIENSASRTRSDVGRVSVPAGPAITRTGGPRAEGSRGDRLERLGAVGGGDGVGQQRVLGVAELRVGVEQR